MRLKVKMEICKCRLPSIRSNPPPISLLTTTFTSSINILVRVLCLRLRRGVEIFLPGYNFNYTTCHLVTTTLSDRSRIFSQDPRLGLAVYLASTASKGCSLHFSSRFNSHYRYRRLSYPSSSSLSVIQDLGGGEKEMIKVKIDLFSNSVSALNWQDLWRVFC